MYKSSNSAGSWTQLGSSFHDVGTVAIVINPSSPTTIYAADRLDHGVLKTTDGGVTWVSTIGGGLNALVMDPSTPSTLYAGSSSGILKTTNGGGNWTSMNSGLTDTFVRALAIDPSTPTTLYSGTESGGVFKSTDGAMTWTPVNTGLSSGSVNSIAIDHLTTSTIYAAVPGAGVFQSTNGGGSWTAINSGLTDTLANVIVVDPTNSQTLYVGTLFTGVFKSTNQGATWSLASTGLVSGSVGGGVVGAIAINPQNPNILYVATWTGVSKSTDGAATWADANNGLTASVVSATAVTGSGTLYAATHGDGAFVSTDGGGAWSPINTGLTYLDLNALVVDPTNPSVLYAGSNGAGVFKSTNGGATWSAIGPTNYQIFGVAVDPLSPMTVYASSGSGVFKSTNAGGSWSLMNTGLGDTYIEGALAVDPSVSGTVYVGSIVSGVYKSTNGGTSWSSMNTGLGNLSVWSLAIDSSSPTTIYAGTNGGSNSGAVYKSTNGGMSWSITALPTSGATLALFLDLTTPAIDAATFFGVSRSTDGGATGTFLGLNGMTSDIILAVAVDPSNPTRIYAGSEGGGVFVFQPVCDDSVVDPGEQCDGGLSNGGLGSCCTSMCQLAASGSVCRPATGSCDIAETCSGSTGTCPTDAFQPAGTPCPDDGNLCTADECDGAANCVHPPFITPGCNEPVAAGRATLLLQENASAAADVASWSWGKGAATSFADFGDPLHGTTDYMLCVYDQRGSSTTLELSDEIPHGGVCGSKPCWRSVASKNLRYRNTNLTPSGKLQASMKAGPAGKASIKVSGKSSVFAVPTLPLVPPVTVQLKASNGMCWDANYSSPSVNTTTEFKSKSD
jgi:hypothetical protein